MKRILSAFAACTVLTLSVSACAAEMAYKDGTLNIEGLRGDGTLIQVSYDDNGTLDNVRLHKAENGENRLNVQDGDKFYLWDGISELVPLSTPLAIEDAGADAGPTTSLEAQTGVFDLKKGTVLLNSGHEMPVLGIGTYMLSNTQAENSVYWALRDGYRLIDTARIYGNETGVGKGIKKAIDEGFVKREEIFVTTKMWTSDFNDGASAIQGSLSRLGLDYIDLMILHHSQPSNDVKAYKAMETAVGEGKLRSIGLSNYYTPSDFDRVVKATSIVPALLQNETHPYHQSAEMKEHLKQYGTVMESWFPLGGRGNTQTLFEDPTISEIAKTHNKTSAQVILRWHLQAGNIAIPGSSNEAHIQENCEIFDFELSENEMERLTAIDKNKRFASY